MKKWVKSVGLAFVIIVIALILGITYIVTTMSPNKLKPLIAYQVMKYTGRTLTIQGDLSWTFFPYLGVKADHIILSNPPQFTDKVFAEIDKVKMGIKVMPLFHASVESSGLLLSGLHLHLIRNANGESNWQSMNVQTSSVSTVNVGAAQTHQSSDDQPVSRLATDNKRLPFKLDIPSIDIDNSGIILDDQQAKQQTEVKNFELHASNLSFDQAFPVTVAFDYSTGNPVRTGQINFSGSTRLDLDKQVYQVNKIQLAVKTNEGNKNLTVNITGDVVADLLQQTLKFEHFVGQVANLTLVGKVNVNDLTTHPHTTGHLQAKSFDLKQLLQALGQDTASLQVAQDVSAEFDFETVTPASVQSGNPFAVMQTLNAQGSIHINQLQASKIRMTNINLPTRLQKGVLAFQPMSADLYQGTVQSQTKVDFNTSVPQITLQTTLSNIQVEPLLQDIGGVTSRAALKGAGNIDLQVTSAGLSADTLIHNLNGTGHISLNNGVLEGVDIGYWIDSAYAVAQKQAPSGQDTKSTQFGTLTASAVIRQGVINNQDLLIDSPRFETKGSGTIDLVTQQINYRLDTATKQTTPTQANTMAYNLIIPIQMSGSLNDPNVRLDVGDVLKQVALQQVKNNVAKQITDNVPQDLQNQAGALIQNLIGK